MSLLPELYQIIVSYTVTLKDILQLRLVCKSWCTYTTKIKTIKIDRDIKGEAILKLFSNVQHIIGAGSLIASTPSELPPDLKSTTIKAKTWTRLLTWMAARILRSPIEEIIIEDEDNDSLIVDHKSIQISSSVVNENAIKRLINAYVKTMGGPFNLSLPEAMFDLPFQHIGILNIETMTNEDYRQYKDLVVADKLKKIVGNVKGTDLIRVSYPSSSEESEESDNSDDEESCVECDYEYERAYSWAHIQDD